MCQARFCKHNVSTQPIDSQCFFTAICILNVKWSHCRTAVLIPSHKRMLGFIRSIHYTTQVYCVHWNTFTLNLNIEMLTLRVLPRCKCLYFNIMILGFLYIEKLPLISDKLVFTPITLVARCAIQAAPLPDDSNRSYKVIAMSTNLRVTQLRTQKSVFLPHYTNTILNNK